MASASDSLKVKVLEQSRIAPPPGSVPTTSLPLTFFDIIWLGLPPVKRLMFFKFHHSDHHFIQTVLPNIKHSLSLALQHFFPFAGNVKKPDHLDRSIIKPEIFYTDGDSVSLTVAESDSDLFDHLTGHHPREVSKFDQLIPVLESKSELLSPLMALQVTMFPNSAGICVGITVSHVVADGKISTQFVKYWASICRFGGEITPAFLSESSSLPIFDRTVIKDPKGICMIYLKQLQEFDASMESFKQDNGLVPSAVIEKVRATFVMSRPEIERLKKWVVGMMKEKSSNNTRSPVSSFHLSTFVLVCAYVWVCLIKSRRDEDPDHVSEKSGKEYFLFAVDCRDRLVPPVPKFYFGNCLLACVAEGKKSDLVGKEGMAVAAEAIGTEVQRLGSESVMERAETLLIEVYSLIASGVKVVSVAGSPNFKVYETDFGWGRPKKVEVVSIEDSGAISLSESGDEEGGIEVGLVLSKPEMDDFVSLFANTLKSLD